jgi:hypothetical protein
VPQRAWPEVRELWHAEACDIVHVLADKGVDRAYRMKTEPQANKAYQDWAAIQMPTALSSPWWRDHQ